MGLLASRGKPGCQDVTRSMRRSTQLLGSRSLRSVQRSSRQGRAVNLVLVFCDDVGLAIIVLNSDYLKSCRSPMHRDNFIQFTMLVKDLCIPWDVIAVTEIV